MRFDRLDDSLDEHLGTSSGVVQQHQEQRLDRFRVAAFDELAGQHLHALRFDLLQVLQLRLLVAVGQQQIDERFVLIDRDRQLGRPVADGQNLVEIIVSELRVALHVDDRRDDFLPNLQPDGRVDQPRAAQRPEQRKANRRLVLIGVAQNHRRGEVGDADLREVHGDLLKHDEMADEGARLVEVLAKALQDVVEEVFEVLLAALPYQLFDDDFESIGQDDVRVVERLVEEQRILGPLQSQLLVEER